MRHFRNTLWSLELANRLTRNVWENRSTMSIEQRAAEKVNSILSQKQDIYVEQSQLSKLERIRKKWMKKLTQLIRWEAQNE